MHYIVVTWYIVHVTAIQNGNFWPRALKFCEYWRSVCGKHFTHQNEQDEYPLYRSHSAHIWRSDVYKTWMAFLSDFLFTLRAQCDAPTYTLTTDQCGARSGSPQLTTNTALLFGCNWERILLLGPCPCIMSMTRTILHLVSNV